MTIPVFLRSRRVLGLLALTALIASLLSVSALTVAPSARAASDPGVDGSTMVLWGRDSVTIRHGAVVTAGGSPVDVVAQADTAAPGFGVAVRGSGSTGTDVRIVSDRVKVDAAATVAGDVFYDEFLRNDGTIGGTVVDDLIVPVPIANEPVFRFGNPGTTIVQVPPAGSATIGPGDYDFIRVGAGATLVLDGAGDYSANYIAVEGGANLHVDGGGGDVEMLVMNSFKVARNAFVGPLPASSTSASHIAVFVEGQNPNQVVAGRIRKGTEFHGTLFVQMTGAGASVEQDTVITGAIFGTSVSVGPRAAITAQAFFPSAAGPGDADLAISKADSADPVSPGDPLTYTVDMTNAGPRVATNVVVTDTLPAGVTFVSTTGCAEDGGVGGLPTCSLGDIASGGSAQFTIDVTVDAGTAGTLTNNASVTSDIVDLNTADNATFEDTLAESADLSITKTDDIDPINAGETLTYTVDVANAGPSAATNVAVTDTLPAGVTFVSSSGCAEDGGVGGVPTCSLGTIASGTSASYDISVTVDSDTAAGTITNNASVVADEVDPNLGDNSTNQDTTVTTEADLTITKTDDVDPILAGNSLTYTVDVSNAGPSDATNVVVTDTLPAGVTFVSSSGCTEDPNGVPNCSLGTIVSGSNASYTVTVTVDTGTTGTITNTAVVASDATDPNTVDNTVGEDTAVDAPNADLSITKTDSVDPVQAGNALAYTVTVANAGPSDATNVVVSDTLPSGVTFVSTSGCSADPNGVPNCNLGTITAGGNAQYTINVTVDAGTVGTITNNASVSSDLLDLNSANDSTTETTTVNAPPAPPVAADDEPAAASAPGDDFHTAFNTTLTVTSGSQVLLDNDTLGSPIATLTSFGSGSLGGAITDNAAGASVSVGAAGSLQVNSDGTFVFAPDTDFTGTFTFDYRLTNTAGTSDATVTIAVGVQAAAAGDARDSLGNVGLDSSVAPTFSLLTNDAGDGLVVTAMDTGSTQGGVVSDLGNGQFTYTPPIGFGDGATDTFTYTIDNGFPGTSTGTVTITVNEVIWFIDNGGAAGTGTLASPFNSLAQFNGSVLDQANDIVFISNTGVNYTGGIQPAGTLLGGQRITGSGATGSFALAIGATVPPNTPTLPAVATTPPIIESSNNGINLGSGNTIRGVDIGDTPGGHALFGNAVGSLTVDQVNVLGAGGIIEITTSGDLSNTTFTSMTSTSTAGGDEAIDLVGVSGTANLGSATISGSSAEGISLFNTSANLTFPSVTIDGSGDFGIRIERNTGPITVQSGTIGATSTNQGGVAIDGTLGSADITIGAAITNTTNNGVNVQDRTGGSVTFTAKVTANTGGSHAVTLANNGGGTINFTGGLDLDTTTGRAFNATTSGTVTVQGSDNSATSTTGTAVFMQDINIGSADVTFASVNSNGSGGGTTGGIFLERTGTVPGSAFVVNGGAILNAEGANLVAGARSPGGDGIGIYLEGVQSATLNGVTVTTSHNFGIRGFDLTGTTAFTNVTVNGNHGNSAVSDEDAVRLDGVTGALNVTGGNYGGGHEDIFAVNNASGTLNATFSGITISASQAATGDNGLQFRTSGSSTANLTVNNSSFNAARAVMLFADIAGTGGGTVNIGNTTPNTFTQGQANLPSGGAIEVLASGDGNTATVNVNVSNNTIVAGVEQFKGDTVVLATGFGFDGTFNVRAINNTIGVSGVNGSAVDPATGQGDSGLLLSSNGGGTVHALIDSNNVFDYNASGIDLGFDAEGPSDPVGGTVNLTVTNNTVNDVVGVSGLANAGIFIFGGDQVNVCLDVRSNSVSNPAGNEIAVDIFPDAPQTLTAPGISAPGGDAELEALIAANNTAADLDIFVGATWTSVGSCPTPP